MARFVFFNFRLPCTRYITIVITKFCRNSTQIKSYCPTRVLFILSKLRTLNQYGSRTHECTALSITSEQPFKKGCTILHTIRKVKVQVAVVQQVVCWIIVGKITVQTPCLTSPTNRNMTKYILSNEKYLKCLSFEVDFLSCS